ncbi:MAG: aldo/keto reductase [Peptococcaceae bacterium]|jgi:predicted aldo/keto reductase-like oxidoreductase|nr:aldo/keto reductase [Peptococcaceae bacterium]
MLMTLGRTQLTVDKDGLGALPLQRASVPEAIRLIQAVVDAGVTYLDTARMYSDSEAKLGLALAGRRSSVTIATKTRALTAEGVEKDLHESLRLLQTDYIDVYQLHNPDFLPDEGHEIYQALARAQQAGKIRFIGYTNHKVHLAEAAVESGLFDTLEYPLSFLSDEREVRLTQLCAEHNVGFIAMKALAGGLITDVGLARRFMNGLENVIPIWGLQRMSEVEALIGARRQDGDRSLSEEDQANIAAEKSQLGDDFCRGCGYCLPCPADIVIFQAARTSLMIRRAPGTYWFSDEWRNEMDKIDHCIRCEACKSRCPYGLDTPELLKRNLADYRQVLSGLSK